MTNARPAPARVDAGTLWAGGAAAGVVAALIVVVGILICRGILDIAVLAPKGEGVWGDADTVTYAAGAFLVALVATGVMHLLMLATPRPATFFGWIVVLATAIAVFAPFAVKASTESRVSTAVINFAVGLAIGTLVAASARSAARKAALAGRPPLAPPTYRTR
ncbi:DUF6069 family protein [Actinoplanes sp. CA-051413]|uniref:DUF6069 family protein n=1 Tax=Actinoplanes sp. CA-051413 TaxID=3239899 RepID=UPI003D99C7B6